MNRKLTTVLAALCLASPLAMADHDSTVLELDSRQMDSITAGATSASATAYASASGRFSLVRARTVANGVEDQGGGAAAVAGAGAQAFGDNKVTGVSATTGTSSPYAMTVRISMNQSVLGISHAGVIEFTIAPPGS